MCKQASLKIIKVQETVLIISTMIIVKTFFYMIYLVLSIIWFSSTSVAVSFLSSVQKV